MYIQYNSCIRRLWALCWLYFRKVVIICIHLILLSFCLLARKSEIQTIAVSLQFEEWQNLSFLFSLLRLAFFLCLFSVGLFRHPTFRHFFVISYTNKYHIQCPFGCRYRAILYPTELTNPSELRCTLLTRAAPCWASLNPAEISCTLWAMLHCILTDLHTLIF